MRTVALSAGSWREATRRAAGVEPAVLPPELGWVFNGGPSLPWSALRWCEFLYVNLHGFNGQPYWYGDGMLTAVSAAQLRGLDLLGVVAFVTACWAVGDAGGHGGPPLRDRDGVRPGPMVAALLEAGCSAVVAGSRLNYSPAVDVLGRWFRLFLQGGASVGRALEFAKARVAFEDFFRPTVATKDALGFVVVGDAGARIGRRAGMVRAKVGGT